MSDWSPYVERYRRGEWRAPIFRDMLLADFAGRANLPTVLDIGCGNGFDGDLNIQKQLAAASAQYIGIEPDQSVQLGGHFDRAFHCFFEDTPLAPQSIDVAFAVMVLEHVTQPRRFWNKLGEVLRPGGVFWGFTVDARHWFTFASLWMKRLRFTDFYLHRFLRHANGDEDYQNYAVFYRANSPRQVLPLVRQFGQADFVNFSRIGQLDYYLPRCLQPVSAGFDRSLIARGKPGAILAMRLVKSMHSPVLETAGTFR